MSPSVYIVLLNWNGWHDTLECLESLCKLSYSNFRIIICDNGSTDNSIQHILNWANGLETEPAENELMKCFTSPPVQKPVKVACVEKSNIQQTNTGSNPLITIIQNGANLGFAAGCNIGIKYALTQGCSYVWLLNNDTVVTPDSLAELIAAAESNPTIGITGSTIRYYYKPDSIQARGGTQYNKWSARTPRTKDSRSTGRDKLDCILGCSMLVSHHFLREVGLMDESYFLYFEELDWAARSKGMFTLRYAEKSCIFHKEGSSIGSNGNRSSRSLLSEFYLSRNRLLFTRRFYPWLLPSVGFSVALAILFRFALGDWKRGTIMTKGALEGIRCPCD